MKLAPRYDPPVILSIEGAPDDQHAPAVRQRRRMEAMLADLDDDGWSSPTRCDTWTVQDVISHLVSVNSFWQMSVLAGLGGTPTRVLDGFDPAATPSLIVAPMRTLTASEVLDQFVTSNDGFLGALADLDRAGWSTLAESPPGHVSIRLLTQHGLWDSWVHERDIALPLGITPPVVADEVLSCLRYAAALSPAFLISSGRESGGTFAVEAFDPDLCFTIEVDDSVTVRDGAGPPGTPCLRGSAVELVEALSIRAPLPESTPPEWLQLLDGLATAFT